MLGKLSRWLRLLGYDTTYSPRKEDNQLLYEALTQERILLTRDRELAFKGGKKAVLIESDQIFRQIDQLKKELNIKLEPQYNRCPVCNYPLENINKKEIRELVPSYTYKTHELFKICPGCSRIYWEGSHKDLINRLLNQKLGYHPEN
ncbi:Mut7-C RNAse domain-containing protein [bacterium]|nr:Mut7-C RNAse domain-containing protein [bacterium]